MIQREVDSLSLRDVEREHILNSNPTEDEFGLSDKKISQFRK